MKLTDRRRDRQEQGAPLALRLIAPTTGSSATPEPALTDALDAMAELRAAEAELGELETKILRVGRGRPSAARLLAELMVARDRVCALRGAWRTPPLDAESMPRSTAQAVVA